MKSVWLGLVSLLFFSILTGAQAEITVPQNFILETYASGLYLPSSLSFNSQGDLFVGAGGAEVELQKIYKIGIDRVVSYFGPALYDPDGVAVDSSNNVYVSGGDTVTRILPDGTSAQLATGFGNLNGIAIDKSNQIFVADLNGAVFSVSQNGQVSLLTEAIARPNDLIFSGNGDLYVTDDYLKKIWKIDKTGIPTVYSNLYGTIALDNLGNLYIANSGEIYEILSNGDVNKFASGFQTIRYMTFDAKGDMFIADMDAGKIYEISHPVPVPASIQLLGTSLVGLIFFGKKYYASKG